MKIATRINESEKHNPLIFPHRGTPQTLEQAFKNGMSASSHGEIPCDCKHCAEMTKTVASHMRDFLSQGLTVGTLNENPHVVRFAHFLMERWGIRAGIPIEEDPWEHA